MNESTKSGALKGALYGAVAGLGAMLFFEVAVPAVLAYTAIGAVVGGAIGKAKST